MNYSYNVKIITPPTTEPVTLTEAKLHLRVDIAEDDALIMGLITAAREEVERQSYHALMTQTVEYVTNVWPYDHPLLPGFYQGHIKLPRPPLQSVTYVTYRSFDGVVHTLPTDQYVVAADSVPAEITPPYAHTWPATVLYVMEAIRVRYVCGFASAAAVPRSLKQAMLLLIGHWYGTREAVTVGSAAHELPMAVDMLCMNYREKARIR